jgi:hypothetical protein
MSIEYYDHQTWDQNIQALAGHLEAMLRERSKTRETIAPYPSTNLPNLIEHNDAVLKSFDHETELIGYRASAAREGLLWEDPDLLRTPEVALDRNSQKWRAEARRVGAIVRPEEYFESRHTAIHTPPLMVRRGETEGVAAPVLWR